MKLVLDTSALIYIIEQRINVEQLLEHEVYIPTAVEEELRLLATRNRKARVALELLQLLRPKRYNKERPADRAVLEAAQELGAVLVTGDSALVKKARALGIPVAKFHKGQLVVY